MCKCVQLSTRRQICQNRARNRLAAENSGTAVRFDPGLLHSDRACFFTLTDNMQCIIVNQCMAARCGYAENTGRHKVLDVAQEQRGRQNGLAHDLNKEAFTFTWLSAAARRGNRTEQ